MRVYRVEHKRRAHGPWCNPHKDDGGGPAIEMSSLGRYFRLPPMHADGENQRVYRTGVRRLQQLTRWFNSDARRELHRHGFVVKVFETQRVLIEDDHQLMFWRPKGTRCVASHSLLDIEE
jgi:hypothetical protein